MIFEGLNCTRYVKPDTACVRTRVSVTQLLLTCSYLHGFSCFSICRYMLFVYTDFVIHVRPVVVSDYGWQKRERYPIIKTYIARVHVG